MTRNRFRAVMVCFILTVATSCRAQQPASFRSISAFVGDSFDIYVFRGPVDSTKPVRTVYYLDAGIRSGHHLQEMLRRQPDSVLQNKLFVGIAHIGEFHIRRTRDFIPPITEANLLVKAAEGQADKFYQYLSKELIPEIDSMYRPRGPRSIIGHSFGGLFVFYLLFKDDNDLFDRYYAWSPSLWVNHFDILHREEAFRKQNKKRVLYLYLSAGTGERFNYVLNGNRNMKSLLEKYSDKGLTLEYQEHKGATHNSQVPYSIAYLLQHLDK
jgi:predicted alpha/beta superfamily hydrolase